jgi:hypothetical protein
MMAITTDYQDIRNTMQQAGCRRPPEALPPTGTCVERDPGGQARNLLDRQPYHEY